MELEEGGNGNRESEAEAAVDVAGDCLWIRGGRAGFGFGVIEQVRSLFALLFPPPPQSNKLTN